MQIARSDQNVFFQILHYHIFYISFYW